MIYIFLYLEDILPVSVDLLAHAINESSFNVDKSILGNIVADFTNCSRSEVDLTIIKKTDEFDVFNLKILEDFPNLRILVTVKPRDRRHEKYIFSKMSASAALRDEINLGMQNEPAETKINVLGLTRAMRTSGRQHHVKIYSNFGHITIYG